MGHIRVEHIGVEHIRDPYLHTLIPLPKGHISRHEAVSMIPALLLDARPGEKVTAIINHYFLIRDIKMFLLTKKKVLDM